ncbi:MAG: hypothetical protein IKY90_08460 [Oscillospiraceae bacterium]|nr:hypothetical protein [Oscillospiraceae bacterium]
MSEEKSTARLIEEMELSVRAYNCLKRAGVQTVEDLFSLLDKGLSEISKSVRNLGRMSLEEILIKANGLGYNSAQFIKREIKAQGLTEYYTLSSEELFKRLIERRNLPSFDKEKSHVGNFLSDIENLPQPLLRFLNKDGIFTMEELLERYKSLTDIPKQRRLRRELLIFLDKEGIRFPECTKEEYPDINVFISKERAKSFHIGNLESEETDDELSEAIDILLQNDYKYVASIFALSVEDMKKMLSTRQIVKLFMALDNNGFAVYSYPFISLSEYIKCEIVLPVEEFISSKVTCSNLIKRHLPNVNMLMKHTRSELIKHKIVGEMALNGIIEDLKQFNLYLKDDVYYECSRCKVEYLTEKNTNIVHHCDLCKDKIKRIKKIKDFSIDISGPDYGSYTDGTKGFTLFATIKNNTNQLEEITLQEFLVFHKRRQWAARMYLNGYKFEKGYIMPQSSLTVAKIWSGYEWILEKLVDGDYISIYLRTKEYSCSYRFVMRDSKFVIDDYFKH